MLQFDPDYKSYVLYTDGGPTEAMKKKKFRGKRKKMKGTFTIPGLNLPGIPMDFGISRIKIKQGKRLDDKAGRLIYSLMGKAIMVQ